METLTEVKFKQNYARHLQHLRLKGLQPKTIEAYSRATRHMDRGGVQKTLHTVVQACG